MSDAEAVADGAPDRAEKTMDFVNDPPRDKNYTWSFTVEGTVEVNDWSGVPFDFQLGGSASAAFAYNKSHGFDWDGIVKWVRHGID